MPYLCRKVFWMRRVVFVLLFFPVVFFSCSPNNVTVDDSLQRYFDSAGVKGSFGLFDNGHGHFTICSLSRFSDSFYTPASTFDIVQSLIAIQTGVVKDETSMVFSGDSAMKMDTVHPQPATWMPAMTLEKAFRTGGDTGQVAFSSLAEELGKDTLKKWIDSLQYGNKAMDPYMDAFWRDNTLKINCDQQLGLVEKLYFGKLDFFQRTQEIVRRMMTHERNSVFSLSYKTAQGKTSDGHAIGWVMGWEEENKHPYFFVVNLESADPAKDLRQTGLEIAKKILQQEGFFEGKK